jgi:hypothetical protein
VGRLSLVWWRHLPGGVPLLVGPGGDHNVVKRRRLLKCHIRVERIAEACDVELDLLVLGERWVTARERHEPRVVVVHRPLAS